VTHLKVVITFQLGHTNCVIYYPDKIGHIEFYNNIVLWWVSITLFGTICV